MIVFVLRFRLLTYWSVPYMIEPLSSRNSRPLPDDAAVFRLVSARLIAFWRPEKFARQIQASHAEHWEKNYEYTYRTC